MNIIVKKVVKNPKPNSKEKGKLLSIIIILYYHTNVRSLR